MDQWEEEYKSNHITFILKANLWIKYYFPCLIDEKIADKKFLWLAQSLIIGKWTETQTQVKSVIIIVTKEKLLQCYQSSHLINFSGLRTYF